MIRADLQPEQTTQEDKVPKNKQRLEENVIRAGQTVLILPNVSPSVIEQSFLKLPFNQLAVLAAIAVDKSVNVIFPRHIHDNNWNVGTPETRAADVEGLVAKCDHVWCVGLWTKGMRLEILKECLRQQKPISFLNWDAINSGFMVEDKQSFKDNEKAEEASQDETAFAKRYLEDNDPFIQEIILGIPPDREHEKKEEAK